MTFPSQDIYLVIRVEKIVQQGISACAEPYIKGGEDTKVHYQNNLTTSVYFGCCLWS